MILLTCGSRSVALCEAVGHDDKVVQLHLGAVEYRLIPQGGGTVTLTTVPEAFISPHFEFTFDGLLALVAYPLLWQDVIFLQVGHLLLGSVQHHDQSADTDRPLRGPDMPPTHPHSWCTTGDSKYLYFGSISLSLQ